MLSGWVGVSVVCDCGCDLFRFGVCIRVFVCGSGRSGGFRSGAGVVIRGGNVGGGGGGGVVGGNRDTEIAEPLG